MVYRILRQKPKHCCCCFLSGRDLLLHALFENVAKVAQISQSLLQKLQCWSTCTQPKQKQCEAKLEAGGRAT